MNGILNIGIIGSGMAGLSAAHVLQQAGHRVTLFERLPQTGLSAHSQFVSSGHIDAPLRVMNPILWRHTLALAQHLGLNTYPVHTDMTCSHWHEAQTPSSRIWLKTQRTPHALMPMPMWSSVPKLPALAWGWWRFQHALKHISTLSDDMTLKQWHAQQRLPDVFWYGCVVPVLLTLCTCDVTTLGQWPAKVLLQFCQLMLQNTGLCRIEGGTHRLAQRLQQHCQHISHGDIQAVWQQDGVAWLKNQHGQTWSFDHIIVATPSQHTDFLDAQQFAQEREGLHSLPHTQGVLINHTDTRWLPPNRSHWTPLSYVMTEDYLRHSFTVWLNPIERSLHDHAPLFQTWQPLSPIADEHIISQATLTRSVCTPPSLQTVARLRTLQETSERRVWLCGSWLCDGLPILESAVTSALSVCARLGVQPTWAPNKT